MDTVSGDPGDRTAFESERAAGGQKVLQPDWRLVAAMGEEAMVAHADAEAAGDPVKDDGDGESLPRKHEESGDGADVEQNHETGGGPVQRSLEGTVVMHAHFRGILGAGYARVTRMNVTCEG